jgi:hypothetical protein
MMVLRELLNCFLKSTKKAKKGGNPRPRATRLCVLNLSRNLVNCCSSFFEPRGPLTTVVWRPLALLTFTAWTYENSLCFAPSSSLRLREIRTRSL